MKQFWLKRSLKASDAQAVYSSGESSGAQGVEALSKARGYGENKNVSRDMTRHFLKNCQAPPVRWHNISVWDTKTHSLAKEKASVPFSHLEDILDSYFRKHPHFISTITQFENRMPQLAANLTKAQQRANLADFTVGALGLWADGVEYRNKSSLEVISANFPSQPS